jgi:starch-binding outer membrane protein, SusD/RagB family
MEKRLKIASFLLVFLIAALFVGYGCSESFFDQIAGDRITPDKHFKSTIDVEISLDGALAGLQDVMPKLVMLDGLRTDMMDVVPGRADANLMAINNQEFSNDNPFIDPSDLYKVIININEILANIDKVAARDRNFDSTVLYQAKGVAIALRSWSYLTISRLYGEAAYIADNLTVLPENIQLPIVSKDAMLDTLISQLTPYVVNPDAGVEIIELRLGGYPNLKGLLGEIYLEKDDYVNAALYLKMACQSYGNDPKELKVDKTYAKEAWKNIFISSENAESEVLGVVPYASTEGQYNNLTRWMSYTDLYMVMPSQIVVDSFFAQVQLKAAAIGDNSRGIGVSFDTINGESYIKKYSVDEGEPYSSDIIFQRAADLHLMLAEALNRSGDSKTALVLLNDGFMAVNPKPAPYSKWSGNMGVRARANLSSKLVPASVTGDDAVKLVEDYIMDERALELAFEGHRWTDLVRVAKRRGDPEYLASKIAAKYTDPVKAAQVHDFLMNEGNWVLPYKK